MPKFEDVRRAQALIMPLAEKALGFAVLAARRPAITKSIAEAVDDPSGKKMAGLAQMFTALASTKAPPAKAPPARAGFTEAGVLDQARRVVAEADAAGATKPTNPLVEDQVKAELVQRSRVGRLMLGRGLTLSEQRDLEETIRARFGESFAGTVTGRDAFGEAVMDGRLGPALSPGVARPQVRTAAQISEDVALPGQSAAALTAEINRDARLPMVDSEAAFRERMAAFAMTVPFGAERLDSPGVKA